MISSPILILSKNRFDATTLNFAPYPLSSRASFAAFAFSFEVHTANTTGRQTTLSIPPTKNNFIFLFLLFSVRHQYLRFKYER